MPLIVDKEAIKLDILMAFQECINEKPFTNITLRDIALKAGMPHSKLLYYFKNKDDLLLSYVKYTQDFMTEKCVKWFVENSRSDFDSNAAYMNAFMKYVAEGKAGENRPNATVQTYVLAHYNKEVGELIQSEFREWRITMENCLKAIYGEEVGALEAEAMMILISGTFICNYNRALTGAINSNILGYLANLDRS